MKLKIKLSKKQELFLRNDLKKINILSGVTGSGKSFISNLKAYIQIVKLKKGDTAIFTGNTTDSLYKNVIKEVLIIDEGINHIEYTRNPNMIKTINGAEVFCIGVNNEGSDKRIKGGSVKFWLADEVTTYPKSSFDMLMSRCREVKNNEISTTPVIFTCNPDHPMHYIKTDYIDLKELHDMQYFAFDFFDNPTMTDNYINDLKQRYRGVFYERMIAGQWCGDTEKMVFPEFLEYENDIVQNWDIPEFADIHSALDPGYNDNTGYLIGYYNFKKAKYVIDNELLLSKANTNEVAKNIKELEKNYNKMYKRVSDTSRQVIADLNQLHGLSFIATKKDDKEAQINFIRVMMSSNKLIINPRCKNLIMQLRVCQYNNNRTDYERMEGMGHFDLVDAMIYLLRNINISRNPYPEYYPLHDKIYNTDYIITEKKHNKIAEAFGR